MSGFLLSHLSLLYNVVRVTAGEASTLQKIHDIILTARITSTNVNRCQQKSDCTDSQTYLFI